jgi:hypothetical protein
MRATNIKNQQEKTLKTRLMIISLSMFSSTKFRWSLDLGVVVRQTQLEMTVRVNTQMLFLTPSVPLN